MAVPDNLRDREFQRSGGDWAIQHTPAANTVATITRAADASKAHYVTSIAAGFYNNAALGAAVAGVLQLRNSTTGAGTIIWSMPMSLKAAAGESVPVLLGGLNIAIGLGNAVTLEFSAAGGANTLQQVALTGYTMYS
jgi:hypothetical protein